MPEWTEVVHARLAAISADPPDPVMVEELAIHLAQTYDDARESGLAHEHAHAAAMRILDASDLLRKTISVRRPGVPRRID